jgi:hypothetical protein
MSTRFPYESETVSPDFDRWTAQVHSLKSADLAELRVSARTRFRAAAAQHHEQLMARAAAAGILLEQTPESFRLADPLVLTGHQPVIFHPGLVYKYHLTRQFAEQNRAAAAAIIIDSDYGDAGLFPVPVRESSETTSAHRWSPRSVSWCTGEGLFLNSQLIPVSARRQLADEIEADLIRSECSESITVFRETARRLEQLGQIPAVAAITILRHAAGIGSGIPDVPLTTLCRLPEAVRFFAGILKRARGFHETYNETLNTFRIQQKIRNPANPFPNLQSAGADFEMPFWMVCAGTNRRQVLWIRQRGGDQWLYAGSDEICLLSPGHEAEAMMAAMFSDQLAVPRGALITAFLRLLFSDLFIHGLGGGKYDPATNLLIQNWWNEIPPPFASATASRRLFPVRRHQLLEEDQLRLRLRDLQQHPEKHLEDDIFSQETRQQIQLLINARDTALDELKRNRAEGVSGKAAGMQLQRIKHEIEEAVGAAVLPRLRFSSEISDFSRQTLESRNWPWFYFPDDPLGGN